MATKKKASEDEAPGGIASYRILAGFVFDHCIYIRGSRADFSEQRAAGLLKRGLIEAATDEN
jgi:hypothetical protein